MKTMKTSHTCHYPGAIPNTCATCKGIVARIKKILTVPAVAK